MANPAETSFNALLHADADVALPDSDAEVIAAILAYGAIYKKVRGVLKWKLASTSSLAPSGCTHTFPTSRGPCQLFQTLSSPD